MNLIRFVIAAMIFGCPVIVFGKRAAPRKVEPVETATLRIIAPLDDGRVGRIQVFDRSDGRLLWSLVVFENRIDPALEEDVQWRFITSLKLVDDHLEISAEGGTRYRVNLGTRRIEKLADVRKRPTMHLSQWPHLARSALPLRS
jgi:hypothetical protein